MHMTVKKAIICSLQTYQLYRETLLNMWLIKVVRHIRKLERGKQ